METIAAGLAAFGAAEPEQPRLLIWENTTLHQAKRTRQAAEQQRIALTNLPYRSPELNPLADWWRSLKQVVATYRAYATVDELAERALDYLDSLSADDRLRVAGLQPSQVD